MSDIFISYARANEEMARRVTQALQALGHRCWRDDQLPVHRAYGQVIEEHLLAARAVVVLWSADAARSEWVRSEANRAREERKLVQLTLDGAALPMPFDQFQCADLRGWAGDSHAEGWRRVVASVQALLDASPPAPVAAPPVQAAPEPRSQLPLPPRLALPAPIAFFGRQAERAKLLEAWASAAAGKGRLLLLSGEAGIGKTRLAAEMAGLAHAQGATVLFGWCDEDIALPYRPFADAIRQYLAHVPNFLLDRHMRIHAAELARLLPELRHRLNDLSHPQKAEAETERFLLFEAVAGLLGDAAAQAPLLLVLDDLHWASASDLLLLKHVVRAIAQLPILILATFRDSDIAAAHPLTALLADFRREPAVGRLALDGLGEDAVLELITAQAGHELDAAGRRVALALHRDTGGNPFFLAEILNHLSESGAIELVDARWRLRDARAEIHVPDSVREVIARRIARLEPDSAQMLTAAAVIGRQFPLDILAHLLETDEDALLDRLEHAASVGLIAEAPGEGDSWLFSQAMVRMTLYEAVSAARRRRMHRRVGEVLEALGGADVDALAFHWAAAGDVGKGVSYARAAGARAAASLAYEAAAAHYARALSVLPADDADRFDLLMALGAMQRSAGDPAFRTTMADAAAIARAARDGHRLALAAIGSRHPGGVQWGNAVDPDLVALYAEALDLLPAEEDVLRIRLMGQLATELRNGPERGRRHALTADALAMARRIGDQPTLAEALMARIFAIEDPSTHAERLAITAELEALTEVLGNAELGCMATNQRFAALLAQADIEGATAAMQRCEALATRLRVPFLALFPRMMRLMLALMRGDPGTEAEAFAAFQAGTAIGVPHASNMFSAQLFELRARQGRLGELVPIVRSGAASLPDLLAIEAGLIHALAQTGALEEASERLGRLVARGMPIPQDMNWATCIYFLAEATGVLEDRAAAALLLPLLEPVAGQVGMAMGVRCDGSLAHPAATVATVLGKWDAAQAFFQQALTANETIGATAIAAMNRRAWANMLVARGAPGDAEQARGLIAAARAVASQADMAGELAKLDQLEGRLSP